jgi:ATP-dependent Clp protease ATP-binding subunit ClpC
VEFFFHCLTVRHTSGRVTVTLVELPDTSVHAETMDSALLDLTLALDDRIGRSHPRNIARYASGADGEAVALRVPALRVWYGEGHTMKSIPLAGWRRPALGGLIEVHVPRLGLRFWVPKGADPQEALAATLQEVLQAMDDGARLGLSLGGRASFETLRVEAEPLRLSGMRPSELGLDMRPFRTREEQAELEQEEANRKRQGGRLEERKRRERERRRTPTLKALAVALHTRAARERIEPAWAREDELARLLAHVERERPQPLVLLAPQGAGKSALLEALSLRMGDPGGPKARRGRPIFALDASRLIAGTGGFGEWQQQLHACLEEARRSGAVLLLGRLVELLDAGRSAHSDNTAAQALAPALAAREVTVIAEATPEDWAVVQRRNASFASVWATWAVPELTPEATREVLDRVAAQLAERTSIKLMPGVVDATLSLCRRFWPYGALVGNAVTFLRRLMAARAHDRAQEVEPRDAVNFFSAEAGIPPVLLRDDLVLDPAAVRGFLAERVMAQPHAVERATQVVSTIKASLQDPRRPAAVLLFAGPTGVGKTELAKALAEFVFGSRERLVRIDMGEYLGPDALARLLGDGQSAGLLPALVRRQPFCVLLLDELEKAHPVVFDALLGVLGEGRLSDASGRVTDFRNAVIVMTTNLGADTLRARVGFGGGDEIADADGVRRHYLAEAQRFFRPEFFNRLDEVVVFRPLGAEAIRAIVVREVAALARREGIQRRDLQLRISQEALDLLAREGLDPRLGARPLKRAIERRLAVPAAAWLASHRQAGATLLHVTPLEGPQLSTTAQQVAERREELRFRAESRGRDAEGSRARAEQVLDEAADLRALVCRWDRSAVARALRTRLTLLTHSIASKGFWDDNLLAEELAREASMLRDLVGPLTELRQGTEAAEDLAVEAWYDRKSETVDSIVDELAVIRERFAGFPRRLYLAREPQATAGILYLTAPRQAWNDLLSLFEIYRSWAGRRGLETQVHCTEYIDPTTRPKTKPDDVEHAWRWRPVSPDHTPAFAAALEVRGGTQVNLLSIEEGGHRFADGSDSVVRMRFFRIDARERVQLRPPKSLQQLMKVEEIRRYSRSRGRLKELRLEEDFPLALAGGEVSFDLDALHDRWIERSCLSEGDLSWT